MNVAVKPWSERRKSHRVGMSNPIRFEWLTAQGDISSTRGMTRDVSAGGVYCYIEQSVDIGLQLEFDVVFQLAELSGRPLMFRCQGRVLRIEERGSRIGVVASIQSRHVVCSEEYHPRAHLRVIPSSLIVAEFPGLHAMVRDLSPIGAFIVADDPPALGRELELQLTGPELHGEIEVKAVIRRVKTGVGVGLEFVFLTADGDRRLREFLERSAGRK